MWKYLTQSWITESRGAGLKTDKESLTLGVAETMREDKILCPTYKRLVGLDHAKEPSSSSSLYASTQQRALAHAK